MLGRIFTVGGYTLLSRLTGFARDIMLAAILGAGPVADAFFVALRLPNHFRAIFAEGAFNAAFVPAYAHVHGGRGEAAARLFADRIFTLLFVSQVVLLVVAWLFMPQAMSLLAPGFSEDPAQRALAIELTRITFPYLLLITLVTLYGGMLNVMHRFASAAAAPIFLNLAMMATLALAAFFPSAGHAAAWGVLISGFLQYFLLAGDVARHGGLPKFTRLRLDEDVRAFFGALGPATLGSMGTQVALFADTIIATFLPAGALSALYYADRLNQLPIGVIGIAIGTVLLPDMSRRLTSSDHAGAMAIQRRAFEFTLLFSVPFVAAFLTVSDVIMRAMFARGAFTSADAAAAAATLAAYAVGLVPFVLIRSAVATFYARKDTATPVKAALTGVAVNVVLKIALVGSLAQIGLALATAVGAWVNLLLVIGFAVRAGYLEFDATFRRSLVRFVAAGAVLAAALWVTARAAPVLLGGLSTLRDEITLGLLIVVGAIVYGAAVWLLFGMRWMRALIR
ncbi:murein biosynthesis integral membrane protein MurJ [Bradyrhizobium sp. U87765 SZCCT0131]|uniref:murein biosynthesis integral membrane protein MurJ n=1 Tax=unclassified Bradyrhizobium TaxID=2631580 RepID=UPI001BA8557F|nr:MULTISPECIES: murein biosynthesis integral membrane protein MurJ [unclassified Bradyrhizobium]MBR1219694.1 murein biosynthesis integral membrane protein MurJ [Bradyrhizobium sp. U87765 SZCCT0131]MBR1262345.1 murein biosynthesis integral membrane protein MurJ [Bradyrhizobium sp. U87765 SZCCT0134]MBR1308472.1 murein biosynthesis integral membrane protein MurJ [Bradyrhizobium sp. U87765 SZCCT0110]MBR1318127.1 murein biosynthesis integral membrane protein MurJ [Bradyrhizobium sp. U87765 SZCCT010